MNRILLLPLLLTLAISCLARPAAGQTINEVSEALKVLKKATENGDQEAKDAYALVVKALSKRGAFATRYTDKYLLELVNREGYRGEILENGGVIRFKMEGDTVLLFNKKNDGDLQLFYGASGGSWSPDQMNTWNRTKRLSRAYLDDKGVAKLEADLLSDGGMNANIISQFLRVFRISKTDFRKYLREKNQK